MHSLYFLLAMLRWDTQHKTDTSKHCRGTLFNNPLDHWNPQNYFSTRAAKKYLQIHYQAITSSYIGTYVYIYAAKTTQFNWIGHFETKVQMSYIRRKLAFIFNFRVVNIAIVLSQPVSSWNQTPSYSDFENFDQNTNVLIL